MMNTLEFLLPGLSGLQHVHPLFVHFPVAFLPAALVLHCLGTFFRKDAWTASARACTYLGVLGAAAAVGTGFLAANQLGHDSPGHDLVHTHRNLVVGAAVLAAVSALSCLARERFGARWNLAFGGLLLATCTVLVLGADRGANLVFRYGIGVQNEAIPASAHSHGGHDHEGHDHAESHGETSTPASESETLAPQGDVITIPVVPDSTGSHGSHDHSAHDHSDLLGTAGTPANEEGKPVPQRDATAPPPSGHEHHDHDH